MRLHDNAALLEYRNENLQEVKLHASAQKLNDYEGRIDVWHSEAKKKIQDAHFSVQVKCSYLTINFTLFKIFSFIATNSYDTNCDIFFDNSNLFF